MTLRRPTLLFAVTLAAPWGCGTDRAQDLRPAPGGPRHVVTVNVPSKLTSIEAGRADARGAAMRVACATCHSIKEGAAALPASPDALDEFHRGLRFAHGSITCSSCHVAGPRVHEELRLADGTQVPMTEVMRLCAQCHGPQYRDYQHGSHGGMTGHWDLRRGGRVRNNCVDCHDPHAPQIPAVRPVLPPRDRFLNDAPPSGSGGSH